MGTPFKPKFFKLLVFLYRISRRRNKKPCGSLELTDRRIDGATSAKTFAAIVIYDVTPTPIRASTGAS